MARVGVAITKSVAFRDSVQEFSNVYFYENGGALPDEAGANALIDALVVLEKTFHSTTVSFLRARSWSQVGTQSQNNMISQKVLTGTGSTTADTTLDRERAFLIRYRAGNDSRGNPVYLRKWYHSCGNGPGNQNPGSTVVSNATGMSTAVRTAIENAVNQIVNVTAGGSTWSLVAKSGRQRDTGFGSAHKYLEHHQLGDMWRQ